MAFHRAIVLLWADIFAGYAMWAMQKYLTNVWKLGFTHSAGIINVYNGLGKALPLLFAFLVDSFLGNYWMLLFSSLAFSIGLGFLSMSTPPVLAKSTRTCRKYESECIGHTQKALFYTALVLVAVGTAGHIVSLVAFAAFQKKNQNPGTDQPDNVTQDDTGDVQFQPVDAMITFLEQQKVNSCGVILVILVPTIGIIALPYIKPWSIRFGLPAIFTLVATLLFLTGCYNREKPEGSPFTSVCRVIVASIRNICNPLPQNVQELYKYNECAGQYTRGRGLRFFEKAAIVPNDLREPDKYRWRLCTVNEVEEAKFLMRLMPYWITFIICGLITSIGSTYFVEQANHMSYKVGKIKAPISIILFLYDSFKTVFTKIYNWLVDFFGVAGLKKYVPAYGIAIAIIFSVLCCITASKIETRRIHVIKSHGLLDKPDATIPMSVFWLLLQFFLLAGHDSFFENSISGFFNEQAPESMKKYFLYFTHAISGVGIVGSVLSVYVVGRVKPNWFQYTLNRSRLDNYYWVLTVLSAGNFVWFLICCYKIPLKKFSLRT